MTKALCQMRLRAFVFRLTFQRERDLFDLFKAG